MSGNDKKTPMSQERASAINSANVSTRAKTRNMLHSDSEQDRAGQNTGTNTFPARANAAAAGNANAAANESKQK